MQDARRKTQEGRRKKEDYLQHGNVVLKTVIVIISILDDAFDFDRLLVAADGVEVVLAGYNLVISIPVDQ